MHKEFRLLDHRAFIVGLTLTLGLSEFGLVAHASDSLFLQDGRQVKGSIKHITGDLIEVSVPSIGFQEHPPHMLRRPELQSRLDTLVTRDKTSYTGQIFYMDDTNIELSTATGVKIQIPRNKVKKMTMGIMATTVEAPATQPTSPTAIESSGNTRIPMAGSSDNHVIPVYSDKPANPSGSSPATGHSDSGMQPAMTEAGTETGNP